MNIISNILKDRNSKPMLSFILFASIIILLYLVYNKVTLLREGRTARQRVNQKKSELSWQVKHNALPQSDSMRRKIHLYNEFNSPHVRTTHTINRDVAPPLPPRKNTAPAGGDYDLLPDWPQTKYDFNSPHVRTTRTINQDVAPLPPPRKNTAPAGGDYDLLPDWPQTTKYDLASPSSPRPVSSSPNATYVGGSKNQQMTSSRLDDFFFNRHQWVPAPNPITGLQKLLGRPLQSRTHNSHHIYASIY